MAVTVTVFYSAGLKRGPGCRNATFGQWLVRQEGNIFFPGERELIHLPVRSQTDNRYVIEPQTAPLNPASNHVELRVATIGEGSPERPVGSADFGADNGRTVEVWV